MDHPRVAVLDRERREGDDELVQVVARVEDLHGGADGVLDAVDEDAIAARALLCEVCPDTRPDLVGWPTKKCA